MIIITILVKSQLAYDNKNIDIIQSIGYGKIENVLKYLLLDIIGLLLNLKFLKIQMINTMKHNIIVRENQLKFIKI